MGFCISEDSEFDDSSIKTAIDLKLSLEILTHSLPKKTKEYISLLLSKYLDEIGLSDSFNKLDYCLSEILFNAIKANMKRVYFKEKNLDINNPDDYAEGMKNFRQETLSNKEYYFKKLRAEDLYVKFSLTLEDGNLILEVRNNSLITPFEEVRVKEKISHFHQYTPDDLAGNFIDETEGAGLGINSILLTLNSFGLPGDNYKLYTQGNETVAKLIYSQDAVEDLEEL